MSTLTLPKKITATLHYSVFVYEPRFWDKSRKLNEILGKIDFSVFHFGWHSRWFGRRYIGVEALNRFYSIWFCWWMEVHKIENFQCINCFCVRKLLNIHLICGYWTNEMSNIASNAIPKWFKYVFITFGSMIHCVRFHSQK